MRFFTAAIADPADPGERIYRLGLDAQKRAISARVGAGGTAEGAAVACINCHGEGAQGKSEAWANPPSIRWSRLSRPLGEIRRDGSVRPPYDESSLTRAITRGIDPGGSRLAVDMPRYAMLPQEVRSLTAYLKRLDGSQVQDDWQVGTFRLPGAPKGSHDALESLQSCLKKRPDLYGHRMKLRVFQVNPGQPVSALIEHINNSPEVLALVSPVIVGHEQTALPLLARADLPVIGPIGMPSAEQSAASKNIYFLFGGLEEETDVLADQLAKAVNPGGKLWIAYGDDVTGRLLAQSAMQRIKTLNPALSMEFAPLESPGQANMPLSVGVSDAVLIVSAKVGQSRTLLGNVPTEAVVGIPWVFIAGAAEPVARKIDLVSLPLIARRRKDASLYGQWGVLGCELTLEALRRAGSSATRESLGRALETIVDFAADGASPGLSFSRETRIGARGAYVAPLGAGFMPVMDESRWISLDGEWAR